MLHDDYSHEQKWKDIKRHHLVCWYNDGVCFVRFPCGKSLFQLILQALKHVNIFSLKAIIAADSFQENDDPPKSYDPFKQSVKVIRPSACMLAFKTITRCWMVLWVSVGSNNNAEDSRKALLIDCMAGDICSVIFTFHPNTAFVSQQIFLFFVVSFSNDVCNFDVQSQPLDRWRRQCKRNSLDWYRINVWSIPLVAYFFSLSACELIKATRVELWMDFSVECRRYLWARLLRSRQPKQRSTSRIRSAYNLFSYMNSQKSCPIQHDQDS